ncbi:MAG: low molecular weight phosphatase family protein [Caldilineaceae bacterium]
MRAKVLFLCTGNYYRSRFAELLFSHLAAQQGAPWEADSRGLAIELGVNNVGPISPHTLARLEALAIPLPTTMRSPQQATEADLQAATLTIALDGPNIILHARAVPNWAGHRLLGRGRSAR